MKLHTDILTVGDLFRLKDETVRDGGMADHVYFDKLSECGSRSRDHAFDVHFASDTKMAGDKRRHVNGGNYGAGHEYAATYDEWGAFIARLFDADPDAVFGPYKGRQEFHEMTRWKYEMPVV